MGEEILTPEAKERLRLLKDAERQTEGEVMSVERLVRGSDVDAMVEKFGKEKERYIEHIDNTREKLLSVLANEERKIIGTLSALSPTASDRTDEKVLWWCAGASRIINIMRGDIE